MKQRLQKLISASGLCSRRAAEELLRQGSVRVNGETASVGDCADRETDEITVDGAPLPGEAKRVCVMINKPRGYVTTLSDEKGRPTVADLVRDAGMRLYPVGRLDMDSDGLLLMTNDGALANALTHPRHEVGKVYRTVVDGDVEAALPILRAPMVIDGYPLAPAEVVRADNDVLTITIHEGRNRQVRKMCAAAGLRVRALTRVAEGPLQLGELPKGRWRYLTEEETAALDALTGANDDAPRANTETP